MNRKEFLQSLSILSGGLLAGAHAYGFNPSQKKVSILLVSGWQYHNIGDIAHTPGLLHLLNIYLPEAEITLWPNHEVREIDAMLLKNFPDLKIVNGHLNDGEVYSQTVLQAAEQADFMLHGSGPSIVAASKVKWWKDHIKKPYGVYGVTVANVSDLYRELINGASFIFTRETHSLKNLQEADLQCKVMGFGPDATFAMHLQDGRKAFQFMHNHGLEFKKFICVVPRLRKTPYYKIYPERDYSDVQIQEINTLNDKNKELDHAKAREAMITWVRQTGNKVLVCPEMTYQIDIMNELLMDPLPVDVKSKVVKRDTYWLCDEPATVYKNAAAVLSFECHSPIMASYNGTPAFYLRQPEDTIKGQMWYDIGLADWVFEIEQTTGEQIANRLMEVYNDYPNACQKLEASMDYVREIQFASMSQVREIIYALT